MHVTIIGAGGVGSVIALRLGLYCDLNIIDADTYEPHNSFRQPLGLLFPEKNKASSHAAFLADWQDKKERENEIIATEEFIDKDTTLMMTDMIIAAVDNNKARNAAKQIAIRQRTPLIIAANEQLDAEASLFLPQWNNTPLDPWVTWPQLNNEETAEEHKPIHCGDPEIAKLEPQTPVANMMAAMGAMWLMEMYNFRKGNIDFFAPIRFSTCAYNVKSKRPCDLLDNSEEAWAKIQG